MSFDYSKPKIGFVGVGKMGSNIARRLFDLKYPISCVNDTRPQIAATVASELGVEPEGSLKSVTARSDIIFTVVTDDQAMKLIYERPVDNLLMQAARKIFINCATFSPHVHVRIAKLAHAAGAEVLEAPMASSITQARSGKLYLMCAGDLRLFERLAPLLDDISIARKFVGDFGTALKVKALVNMVMNINTAGLAEGLGLASAMGLDVLTVKEVFGQAGAASRVLITDGDDMINREHEAFFTAAHAAKDSGIALDLARENHLNVPMAITAKNQYDKVLKLGLGHLDKSAVSELTFPERHPEPFGGTSGGASVVKGPTATGKIPFIR